jgi:hypothetical protein
MITRIVPGYDLFPSSPVLYVLGHKFPLVYADNYFFGSQNPENHGTKVIPHYEAPGQSENHPPKAFSWLR